MWRRILRHRQLIPAAVLLTVVIGGLVGLESGASAAGSGYTGSSPSPTATATTATTTASSATTATGPTSAATSSTTGASSVVATPPLSCQAEVDKISAKLNATGTGAPKGSTTIQCTGSQVVAYGNPRVIRYTRPTSSAENIAQGKILFEQNCSSCHSADATGSTKAPALRGVVGPGTVEFWVDTGRMPATNLLKVQAQRRPPRLNPQEASQVAAFINSLTPRAPYVPTVTLRHANLTTGASLFALNCAACHTITGFGDELGFSTNAPTLRDATPAQIAEAIRSGPGNMPIFAGNLSDGQVRDIVAYVSKYIQHPDDPGGAGLGGVGPVGEGFVALLFGAGGLMLVCFWIGERS